ncbi:MAG TPA: hypothetical protein VGF24_25805 [Vicinamibacterales bacterium]|jgi:hypothetical protein
MARGPTTQRLTVRSVRLWPDVVGAILLTRVGAIPLTVVGAILLTVGAILLDASRCDRSDALSVRSF